MNHASLVRAKAMTYARCFEFRFEFWSQSNICSSIAEKAIVANFLVSQLGRAELPKLNRCDFKVKALRREVGWIGWLGLEMGQDLGLWDWVGIWTGRIQNPNFNNTFWWSVEGAATTNFQVFSQTLKFRYLVSHEADYFSSLCLINRMKLL